MSIKLRESARLLAVLTLLLAPGAAVAGSRSLPPDVDLDPDRGMSFGRLPKTSFDRRAFDSLKHALGSRATDPSIDPWNPVVRPSRFEPGSGKIRDSYSDKVRELRREEESRRKTRTVQRGSETSPRYVSPHKGTRSSSGPGTPAQRKSDD